MLGRVQFSEKREKLFFTRRKVLSPANLLLRHLNFSDDHTFLWSHPPPPSAMDCFFRRASFLWHNPTQSVLTIVSSYEAVDFSFKLREVPDIIVDRSVGAFVEQKFHHFFPSLGSGPNERRVPSNVLEIHGASLLDECLRCRQVTLSAGNPTQPRLLSIV